jgi:hypothetical protein
MSNAIQLRGAYERYEDLVAPGQTITPGMIVEVAGDGVSAVASVATLAEKAFAVEDALQGKPIYSAAEAAAISAAKGTTEVSGDYTENELCQYNIQKPGNRVYAWIVDANTQLLARGTTLGTSNTAGCLQEHNIAGEVLAVLGESTNVVANIPTRAAVRIL